MRLKFLISAFILFSLTESARAQESNFKWQLFSATDANSKAPAMIFYDRKDVFKEKNGILSIFTRAIPISEFRQTKFGKKEANAIGLLAISGYRPPICSFISNQCRSLKDVNDLWLDFISEEYDANNANWITQEKIQSSMHFQLDCVNRKTRIVSATLNEGGTFKTYSNVIDWSYPADPQGNDSILLKIFCSTS